MEDDEGEDRHDEADREKSDGHNLAAPFPGFALVGPIFTRTNLLGEGLKTASNRRVSILFAHVASPRLPPHCWQGNASARALATRPAAAACRSSGCSASHFFTM